MRFSDVCPVTIRRKADYSIMRLVVALFLVLPLNGNAQNDFFNYDFSRADSVAFRVGKADLEELDVLVKRLTSPFENDLDKFRAIYRWVAENIAYDVDAYHEYLDKEVKLRHNRKKFKQWAKSFDKAQNRNLIRNQKGLCSGYAYLIDAMCQLARIDAETIEGYGRTSASVVGKGRPNHAWNAVLLNKKWYLCDATWSSGAYDPVRSRFVKDYTDTYFLTDPEYFLADHYPKIKTWTLVKNPPSLSEFHSGPIKLEGYHLYKMVRIEPKAGNIKAHTKKTSMFRFTANRPIQDKLMIRFESKNWTESTTVALTKEPDGYYRFDLEWIKPGNYRVFIYLNRLPALLYQVSIKN